ncbi:hypothetical protein VULLAG_LOCUS10252 [Vulpes lagopus]
MLIDPDPDHPYSYNSLFCRTLTGVTSTSKSYNERRGKACLLTLFPMKKRRANEGDSGLLVAYTQLNIFLNDSTYTLWN